MIGPIQPDVVKAAICVLFVCKRLNCLIFGVEEKKVEKQLRLPAGRFSPSVAAAAAAAVAVCLCFHLVGFKHSAAPQHQP